MCKGNMNHSLFRSMPETTYSLLQISAKLTGHWSLHSR